MIESTSVMTGDAGAIAPEWIACMGHERSVIDDRVVCPLGTLASSNGCLACYFLEGSENDRLFERGCSVDARAHPAGPQPGTPTASWAEPIIELP